MNKDLYMLVRLGVVLRFEGNQDGKPARVWPVAESYDDAARLAEWTHDPAVRAARIGSFPGETLGDHIDQAVSEGCVASCCVAGWNADGSPRFKWIVFDQASKSPRRPIHHFPLSASPGIQRITPT